ncbi:MAG: ribulose-phosphate 3-epimerase [Actinomycetota bacterium]|nr:ribulose-phosphate 3-epimerase [Actinomycetota bacterium]
MRSNSGKEKGIKLAPSILDADFSKLGEELKAISPYADYIHLDIMDGHFVPNLTFGPMIVETVKRVTQIPIDCHLMIYHVPEWIEAFIEAGADRLSFHLHSTRNEEHIIRTIRNLGASPGLALSPEVPPFELRRFLEVIDFVIVMCVYPGFGGQPLIREMLPRINAIKREARDMGVSVEVEVDGGIKTHNLTEVLEAGADTVVVGSSIFSSDDHGKAAAHVRSVIDTYHPGTGEI